MQTLKTSMKAPLHVLAFGCFWANCLLIRQKGSQRVSFGSRLGSRSNRHRFPRRSVVPAIHPQDRERRARRRDCEREDQRERERIYEYMSNRQNSRILSYVLAGHWFSEAAEN